MHVLWALEKPPALRAPFPPRGIKGLGDLSGLTQLEDVKSLESNKTCFLTLLGLSKRSFRIVKCPKD